MLSNTIINVLSKHEKVPCYSLYLILIRQSIIYSQILSKYFMEKYPIIYLYLWNAKSKPENRNSFAIMYNSSIYIYSYN